VTEAALPTGPASTAGGEEVAERVLPVHDREELRSLMWDLVGIVRTDERLGIAAARVAQMAEQNRRLWARSAPDHDLVELRNLLGVATLIVESAMRRRESRGLHFNADLPFRDNEHFLAPTVLQRSAGEAGA
jgi:L-aspartate oxidase